MFTLKISTANDAFDNEGVELARILRIIARRLEMQTSKVNRMVSPVLIRDINGNTVGNWSLS